MPETVLDYDKQIWTVFSVGVVASVVILYNVISDNLKDYEIWALILGFSILVYCFFAIWGYGVKKKVTIDKLKKEGLDRRLYKKIGNTLDDKVYSRSRWMGEAILLMMGGFYFYHFKDQSIPFFILILAGNMILLANIINKLNNF